MAEFNTRCRIQPAIAGYAGEWTFILPQVLAFTPGMYPDDGQMSFRIAAGTITDGRDNPTLNYANNPLSQVLPAIDLMRFASPIGQSAGDVSSIKYLVDDATLPYNLDVTFINAAVLDEQVRLRFGVTAAVRQDQPGADESGVGASFYINLTGSVQSTPPINYDPDRSYSVMSARLVSDWNGKWVVHVRRVSAGEHDPFEVWADHESEVENISILVLGASQLTRAVSLRCRYDARIRSGMLLEMRGGPEAGTQFTITRVQVLDRYRFLRLSCEENRNVIQGSG